MTNPYFRGKKAGIGADKLVPDVAPINNERPGEIDFTRVVAPVVDVWANCEKCGWHYKQSKLDDCPMCHHAWRLKVAYEQPPFEGPNLD